MAKEKAVKGADSLSATENILWEELKKALTYFNEALLYTDRKRKWNRWVDSMLLCVGIGATFCREYGSWISPAALVLMTAILSCKSDILRFLQSEEELTSWMPLACSIRIISTMWNNFSSICITIASMIRMQWNVFANFANWNTGKRRNSINMYVSAARRTTNIFIK